MNKYTERMNNTLEKLSDSREKFLGNLVDKLENYIDINSELELEYNSLSNTDNDYREILDVLSDEVMNANRIKMMYYFDKASPFIAMEYFMRNISIQEMKLNESSD